MTGWIAAALLASFSGALPAQTFTVSLSPLEAGAPFYSVSVSSTVGWDVTVDLDPGRCELHCTYRRKPVAGMPMLLRLSPPTASIRLYGGAALPVTIVVDPAGIRQPGIESVSVSIDAEAVLPPRRVLLAALAPRGPFVASLHFPPSAGAATARSSASHSALPLRI